MSLDETPNRMYMDDPKIVWRDGKPDYTAINQVYLNEKTRNHKADSLEKLVENLVKTYEMETVHKERLEDWQTIDRDNFWMQVNGGRKFTAEEVHRMGSYNTFLDGSPLYDITEHDSERSSHIFKTAFPGGFIWEVLEVLSGPPKVTFKWRHWTKWTGPYKEQSPTGEHLEFHGVTIATVTNNLKVQSLEFFMDFNTMLSKMGATRVCPVSHMLTYG